VIAQYVLAEIAAPMYASMLPEAPLQNFETQNRTINDEMQADMGGNRADGSHRAFAAFNYSHDRFDQTSTSPQTSLRDDTLVLGSDYFVNHFISFGVATTLTHQNATFGNGGSFSNNEPMLAAWGMWHTPDYWLSVLGSVGQLNFNGIDRVIQLGTATRTETANTGGSHVGFEVGGGYLFHWDEINTGPFATLSHQRVRVSSFNENGSDSTTMFFGRQDRDSTIWRVGWELNGSSKLMGGDWHPYARVAYDHETDDKARLVSAGVVGMNGTFSMPGFQPDSQFWTGELGVAADFGSNLTAFAGYDGMFGNANERVDSFNLGFKWKW
jgi:outer membrane lipase/esterase